MKIGTDDQLRVERLVEQALFGPLDLTIRVVEELPEAIDKARQQLFLARFVGRLAVEQGVGELRRRLEGTETSGPTERATATRRGANRERSSERQGRAASSEPSPPGEAGQSVPAAADLALPDYEQLPAAHIVAKLGGLTPPEREAIEVFERAHRHRRTILGKLDQLRAG